MPTPTVYPTSKQFLGWAKETTQGTAVAPTSYMPFDSFQPADKPTWLDDKARRAAMAATYGRVQGPIHTEFQGSGPAFMDQIPALLYNILGDLVSAGTTPKTHTLGLLNSGTGQPPSLTLAHWQGTPATNQVRLYAGACLSELTLSGNADSSLITVEFKGTGYPSAISGSPVTPTFSAVLPQASWRYQIGLGGTVAGAPNKKIRDWTFTFARELRVENTSQNSQSPFIIQRGQLEVTGSATVTVPNDETEFLYLINNTQPQLQVKGDNGGAGATLFGLQLDAQLCAMDTDEIKLDEEAIGYNLTWLAIANATNVGASGGLGPATVVVTNQTASY